MLEYQRPDLFIAGTEEASPWVPFGDNGMKTVFWLNGSLEFYDDDDNLTETFDVFWYIDHYLSYCKEHGLPVNDALFV